MAGPAPEPSVFLDADVLIAGSFSASGASRLILRLAAAGLFDAVTSTQALDEAERNLRAKVPAGLAAFRLLARRTCRVVDASAESLARAEGLADPKDAPILAAVLEAGCSSLVTFNTRHYRAKRAGIRVETPGDFVARVRERLGSLGRE